MAHFNRITKHFNGVLARSFLLIFLSTLNYGFDNQGFNTTEAMIPFKREFGYLNPKTGKYALETYWLSLFNSLNYVGFAAGIMIGSYISSRWGRRMCIFAMSCWALCGATITITANNKDHILAGRVLTCKHHFFKYIFYTKLTLHRYLYWHGTICDASLYVRDCPGSHSRLCCWLISIQSSGESLFISCKAKRMLSSTDWGLDRQLYLPRDQYFELQCRVENSNWPHVHRSNYNSQLGLVHPRGMNFT